MFFMWVLMSKYTIISKLPFFNLLNCAYLRRMTFLGRLKFYGIGFGIGLLMVYAIFGTRTCESPKEIKLQQLVFQHMQLSEKAKCKLKALGKNEALLKIELRHFEIDYDASDIHKDPCGQYFIQPKPEFASQYNYKLVINDCDTISRINDISVTDAKANACQ